MVARKGLTGTQRRRLAEAVADGLRERGYDAAVKLQASKLRGRYQLVAVADDFRLLSEAERQDTVWQVLREKWTRAQQIRLTLVAAMTRREANGDWTE